MNIIESNLKDISAGHLLDVATGNGNFIRFLLENLKDFDEIIGIDTSEKAAAAFTESYKDRQNIHFFKMDAANMGFAEASFDAVCISNSLHHMSNLDLVLAEMKRVLRPGGYIILSEMYNDNQAETQMTHVLIHHWLAAVDTALCTTHHETYSRQKIVEIIGSLGLNELILGDVCDLTDDPKDSDTIKSLNGTIDQTLKRIEILPKKTSLRERGLELRQRVENIGFHSATSIFAIGRKP